jgi:hypothetical protein
MNCVLAVLQTYGATSSLSYSLFATMADSIFDPFSNITLWIAHRKAKKIDERKYPAVPPALLVCTDNREKHAWQQLGIYVSRSL